MDYWYYCKKLKIYFELNLKPIDFLLNLYIIYKMEESRIKVVVRKRPISKKELTKSEVDIVEVI